MKKKTIAVIEDETPMATAMANEITIYCFACNYKIARGGYNEPGDRLTKTEVLTLAQHNPHCKINSNCECVVSVSNEVEVTDTAHITHYLIHLA